MDNIVKLREVTEISSGQIIKRVAADESAGDKVASVRKVIVPKAILNDGTINVQDLDEEKFKTEVDVSRITKDGDIVIKLSTPYDSAIITKETEGLVIPSFCAIIRCQPSIDRLYMQAFLSSTVCKEQLQKQVTGVAAALLTIGRLGDISIPLPDTDTQVKIGQAYKKTQERIVLMKRIVALESKKSEIIFKELFNNGK